MACLAGTNPWNQADPEQIAWKKKSLNEIALDFIETCCLFHVPIFKIDTDLRNVPIFRIDTDLQNVPIFKIGAKVLEVYLYSK